MVTFQWAENQERTVTRTESAITTGPVTTVVGQSNSGPGQPAQPIWRTQLGTFVTTWQVQTNETVREPHALVLVFETKDGKPLSPVTELRSDPVLQSKGVGKNAGRDALAKQRIRNLEFASCAYRPLISPDPFGSGLVSD